LSGYFLGPFNFFTAYDVLAFITLPLSFENITASAWVSLVYVSLFSMFIGFIFWYRGLALGSIAIVGQLQLLQPFFGLALAALLLDEKISIDMIAVTIGVNIALQPQRNFPE
jgi:drug/metabolite transporter (DMT)-like permease